MRVLVSGATGFLGRHALSRLVTLQCEIVAVSGPNTAPLIRFRESPRVLWISPAEDLDSVPQVDCILHLATFFTTSAKPSLSKLVESNLLLGLRLLELSRRDSSRMVSTSTFWQLDPRLRGLQYTATKKAMATMAATYAAAVELDYRELLIPDTYGPDDSRGKLIDKLLTAAACSSSLTLNSPNAFLYPMYVDDVVDALLLAVFSQVFPSVCQLNPMDRFSVQEIVEVVQLVTGGPAVEYSDTDSESTETPRYRSAFPNPPGWKPKVALEEGIRLAWRQK